MTLFPEYTESSQRVLAGQEGAVGNSRYMLWIIPEVGNTNIVIKRGPSLLCLQLCVSTVSLLEMTSKMETGSFFLNMWWEFCSMTFHVTLNIYCVVVSWVAIHPTASGSSNMLRGSHEQKMSWRCFLKRFLEKYLMWMMPTVLIGAYLLYNITV